MAEVKDLIGKTLTSMENVSNKKIVFTTDKGKQYMLYHDHVCCESVMVEDIVGDLADLVGDPILVAEVATSSENPDGVTKEYQESFTWTFYKFATCKGYVDIRWYGESNGFYGESVDFYEMLA